MRMMSSQFLHSLPCNRTACVGWHFPPQQQPTPPRPMSGHDPSTPALSAGKWSTCDLLSSLSVRLGAGSCPGDPTLFVVPERLTSKPVREMQ